MTEAQPEQKEPATTEKDPESVSEQPEKKSRPKACQQHDMNDDGFDYVILGTNLTENILGA